MTSQITGESTQVSEEEAQIKAEVDELKNRLCELLLNRPIMTTGSAKIKTPTFDGTELFQSLQFSLKLQFEKAMLEIIGTLKIKSLNYWLH